MAKQFKKYGVDHSALYEAVHRDNRYHDDRTKPRSDEAEKSIAPSTDVRSEVAQPEPVAPRAEPEASSVAEGKPPTPAAEPETLKPAQTRKAEVDLPPSAAPAAELSPQKIAPKSKPKAVTSGANLQLRLRLRFPAEGVSPSFDGLARDHGPELAFKAIFKRAFDDYRAALDAGSLPDGPKDYAIGKGSHSSTKMMTPAQYQLCMDTLDPKGLLPPMTVGRIIGERALALFFQKEKDSA